VGRLCGHFEVSVGRLRKKQALKDGMWLTAYHLAIAPSKGTVNLDCSDRLHIDFCQQTGVLVREPEQQFLRVQLLYL
jgi:hypothetical protein